MTDKQLPELTAGGALSDPDLFLSRQDGATIDKKITASQFKTYIENSLNVDLFSNGSTNTFLQIDAADTLKSYDATAAHLQYDIAIGFEAEAGLDGDDAGNNRNIAIGYQARAYDRYSTAIGERAEATETNTSAFGQQARATAHKATALGNDSLANGEGSLAIKGAASGENAIAIKANGISGNRSVGIGSSSVTHDDCFVVGQGNISTDDNQFKLDGKVIIGGIIGTGNKNNLPTASDNDFGIVFTYNGSASGNESLAVSNQLIWKHIPLDALDKAGDTMTGALTFSGTEHYGLTLISLTTSQRNALSPAGGEVIFNSTSSLIEAYNGSEWVNLGNSGSGSGSIAVKDEGTQILASATSFNFVGTGVSTADSGNGEVTVTIAGGSAPVDSVNGQTGAVSLDADDINDTSTTHKFISAADLTKLAGIETGATANTGALADKNTIAQADIDSNVINASKLQVTNSPSDNQILSYDQSSGGFTWVNDQSGSGSIAIKDEGSQVSASANTFNFVGTGVTATDAGSGEVTVTIAGGSAPVDSVNGQTGVVSLDADDINDTSTTHKFISAADLTKLAGIETAATANSADASLVDRSNHTGSQPSSTISDFNTSVDARITASDKISSDASGVSGADAVANIMSLTQAEYDAIGTPNTSTLYFITDAT